MDIQVSMKIELMMIMAVVELTITPRSLRKSKSFPNQPPFSLTLSCLFLVPLVTSINENLVLVITTTNERICV